MMKSIWTTIGLVLLFFYFISMLTEKGIVFQVDGVKHSFHLGGLR